MSKITKICFSQINNAGDRFNYDLLEFFDVEAEIVGSSRKADLLMIGGGISDLQKTSCRACETPLHVWGTGFLYGDDVHDPLCRTNLIVHALRGRLSKMKLEGLLGKPLPTNLPLADPGLLASFFSGKRVDKKHAIGFIPHFREHESDEVKLVLESRPDMHFIDITQEPLDVIGAIQECDTIVSSSLHGLVFSDSLHIPNTHAQLTELPKGGSFKFRDYYSSFDLSDPALTVDDVLALTPEAIKTRYQVTPQEIEKKKRQLIRTFPLRSASVGHYAKRLYRWLSLR